MACTKRVVTLKGLNIRSSSSSPLIFLYPVRVQRRTFISRLLGKRSRNNLPQDAETAAQRQRDLQAESSGPQAPPTLGRLLPGSVLDDIPPPPPEVEPDINDDLDDLSTRLELWKDLHPAEQAFIVADAKNKGWTGTASQQQIPPLDIIEAALRNKEKIKPEQDALLKEKVREMVKKHGRLDRQQIIARSERELRSRSPFIKTSIKKLQPLARQIAGKKIEDAMLQMRFSKKRAATDVLKHLEYARNKAMTQQQMGLGKPAKNILDAEDLAVGKEAEEVQSQHDKLKAKTVEQPVVVRDRKDRRQVIDDRSAIYIDQAWVGRGKWEFDLDHRARGKIHRLYKPFTTISVLLKEERTRLREAQERQAKRERKPVWVNLPDRPVTRQRQYPLW